MNKTRALLVIDMQEFFFSENKVLDKNLLGRNCREIVEICRRTGIPVIYIITTYRKDKKDWPRSWAKYDETWCSSLVKGCGMEKAIPELSFPDDAIIVEKKRFSSFYNTNLDDILRNMDVGVIDMIGYSADVCVRFTSVDAYNRGYKVNLVSDGLESFKETKEDALEYIKWLTDARIINLKDYEQDIQNDFN